jgi:hypothetical protein
MRMLLTLFPLPRLLFLAWAILAGCGRPVVSHSHVTFVRNLVLTDDSSGVDSVADAMDTRSAFLESDSVLVLWVATPPGSVRVIFKGLPRRDPPLRAESVMFYEWASEAAADSSGRAEASLIPFEAPDSLVNLQPPPAKSAVDWKKGFLLRVAWPHRSLSAQCHMIRYSSRQPHLIE